MKLPPTCLHCGAPMEPGRAAELDQSGGSVLPAREYLCPKHPDVVTTIATGEPARAAGLPVAAEVA